MERKRTYVRTFNDALQFSDIGPPHIWNRSFPSIKLKPRWIRDIPMFHILRSNKGRIDGCVITHAFRLIKLLAIRITKQKNITLPVIFLYTYYNQCIKIEKKRTSKIRKLNYYFPATTKLQKSAAKSRDRESRSKSI